MTATQLKPRSDQFVKSIHIPSWVNKQSVIAFEINSDAMEPEYQKGNIVLVDTSRRIPCDSEYLVEIVPGSFSVKTIQVPPGIKDTKVTVISRNKKYPPFGAYVHELGVVGKVIAKLEWKQ